MALTRITSEELPVRAPAPPIQWIRVAERSSGSGALLIFLFWTLYGMVMTGGLFLSPLRQATSAPWELVAFSFLGTYVWAALTLPLFALTRRMGRHEQPIASLGGRLVGIALVVALLVSIAVAVASSFFVRETLDGSLQGPDGVWVMARYRYLNDVLACSLILTAGLARDFFLRYRDRQEEASQLRVELAQARLELLRSQLNPHFLFNTLNAVAALVSTDPKAVRRMIAGLSELLRFSLEGAAELEITLREELQLTQRYLEIMEIRYQGRLQTEIRVDPEILQARVPNLILQPLVENAMVHGIGEASGYGRVDVEATVEEGTLRLIVRDSGSPDSEPAESSGREHRGFGLRSTRERLQRSYGSEASLSLTHLPEGGTVAEIRLPYREESRPAAGFLPPVRNA